MKTFHLGCRCGDVRLSVVGPHIATVECLCESCGAAARALEELPGIASILDEKGATAFVMHRKDRVTITAGRDCLKAHRLSAEAGTRRVIATCCNTPIFLEVKGGHWLSLYRAIWPDAERPAVEMRTMTGERTNLPSDVPNLKTHSLAFYGRLFAAWAKMGFRNPHIADNGELHAEGR